MINELIKKYQEKVEEFKDDWEVNPYIGVIPSYVSELAKEILKDLKEMKAHQLHNLNEVKSYLNSKKVTPEMVALALRKIEISILGDDTDE